MNHRAAIALSLSLALSLCAGCQSHPLAGPEPHPGTSTDIRYEPNAKLDLLFLIDDSRSMEEEQASLRQHFPRFMEALEQLPDGLPDLHIAVVSSDFGAGGIMADTCHPLGDRGRFQVKPGCGLDPRTARYLATDGRTQNFEGKLADAFSCMANLGAQGCGYEHQLQSIRAALSDVNPENAGFLRPDAYLGIIILSDEDDCSADPDSPIFDTVLAGQSSDLRCATLGHVCGGQPVPAAAFRAPLGTCQPYQRAPEEKHRDRLIDVAEIVDYVKYVKGGRADHVIVSGVFGWTDDPGATYAIGVDKGLELLPICSSKNGSAAPALRLKAFVDAFGANGSWRSICEGDLERALGGIGEKFADVLRRRCLPAPLVDVDPKTPGLQAECQVKDRLGPAEGNREVPLPSCGSSEATPCWRVVEDAACPYGQRVDIDRGGGKSATPALELVQCLSCTVDAAGRTDCGISGRR